MKKTLRIIFLSTLFLLGLTGCLRGRLRFRTPGLVTLSPTAEAASPTNVTANPATATGLSASQTLSTPTPSMTPSMAVVPSLPPTPGPFWQEWESYSRDLGAWLNSDPTVSPGEIP